jgi:hypothetical protein
MTISLSSLTKIRLYRGDDAHNYIEIFDPENNFTAHYGSRKPYDATEISSLINELKQAISNDPEKDILYQAWFTKGWQNSLDYYVSTRSLPFDSFKYTNIGNLKKSQLSDDFLNPQNNLPAIKFNIPEALLRRRSKRVFNGESVPKDIFQAGIENFYTHILDSLYGIELYFIIFNVEKIISGVHYYNCNANSFSLINEGNFAGEMIPMMQGMRTASKAAFTIVLTANFDDLLKMMPYERGLRNVYIDAGRLAQKLIISYAQYDIHCLVTPALSDCSLSRLLQLEEPHSAPLYSLTFGYAIK